MRLAVQSPEGEDECEWLAVHSAYDWDVMGRLVPTALSAPCAAVDFFNEVSLLYGTVAEFCTKASCPTMSAGSRFEYLWADGVTVTKARWRAATSVPRHSHTPVLPPHPAQPIKVTAPEYVDLLMTWVEGQINSERLFPTSTACAFPRDFKSVVSNIFKRLFRGAQTLATATPPRSPFPPASHPTARCCCAVYAHIYYSHFDKIVALGAERHLNTCFKHCGWKWGVWTPCSRPTLSFPAFPNLSLLLPPVIFFVKQFALIDAKELAPLDELIAGLMGGGDGPSGAGAGGPGAAAPAAGRGGGSSSGAAKA
jgi:MOB kinase activator 1